MKAPAARSVALTSHHRQLFRAISAMVYYISVASGLTIINKSIFSTYRFSHPLVLVEAQLLCTLLLFQALCWCRVLEPPVWSFRALPKLLPLVASYLLMLMSGMFGLKNTSLVMYNTLRRTTVAFVLILEYLVLRVVPSIPTLGCVAAMTVGAVWAGSKDSAFDFYGYGMIFLANMTSALYVVLVRKVKQSTSWNNTDILYLNSMLSAPLVLMLLLWRGELVPLYHKGWQAYPWSFYAVFLVACLMGFIINHSIYYNTNTNSPLTQTVSAQVKDVILLAASAPFDGTSAIIDNLAGILISLLGSVAYSVIKYREHVALPENHR
jgi:solute carrier family 35 protein